MLPAVLQLKAVALAAQRYTEFSGFWHDEGYQPAPAVHVGVAISLRGGGLVAPAIHDVAEKKVDVEVVEVGCLGMCSEEPMVDVQLPGKARSIGLNRLHSHEKLFGDFRTGVTSRHEVEHLQLTAAKEVCPPFGTGF